MDAVRCVRLEHMTAEQEGAHVLADNLRAAIDLEEERPRSCGMRPETRGEIRERNAVTVESRSERLLPAAAPALTRLPKLLATLP
jgi:hypothetical protein